MTNTELREKLVELMKSQPCLNSDCCSCEENGAYCELYKMADFFIANGVTFAKDTDVPTKWISVEERLPELIPCNAGTAYSEAVIVWTSGKKAMIAVYDGIDFVCPMDFWEAWGEEITHWMPLPDPPKEE